MRVGNNVQLRGFLGQQGRRRVLSQNNARHTLPPEDYIQLVLAKLGDRHQGIPSMHTVNNVKCIVRRDEEGDEGDEEEEDEDEEDEEDEEGDKGDEEEDRPTSFTTKFACGLNFVCSKTFLILSTPSG